MYIFQKHKQVVILSKGDAEKVLEIIREKMKPKKVVLNATLEISSTASNGLILIKKALLKQEGIKITYTGAPNYILSIENENPKIASKKLDDAIESLTKIGKKDGLKIEIKKRD